MENYGILFPDLSRAASASPSLNNIANHQIQAHLRANGVNPMKFEAASHQYTDAKNNTISDHGVASYGPESKVKSAKQKGDKETRKHKYAFQTRSRVDILDDGYRWRKYGQKTVKNSKFPRSYYRCTHKGCNVKKQIQRSSKDEEIVVTTYEGTHTHTVEKFTENFEMILRQMQTFTSF